MAGPAVQWRTGSHQLSDDDELLRFHVVDLNAVINKAVGDADLYRDVLRHLERDSDQSVLALSAYALTGPRAPEEVTGVMPGRDFLTVPAARLLQAGIEVWPTTTYIDGTADPLGDVHFDVIVAAGHEIVPPAMFGSKSERGRARRDLRPLFDEVLELFDGPFKSDESDTDSGV